MKPKSITYSKVYSDHNYGNEKVEITVEIEENELPEDVFSYAKSFVESSHQKSLDADKVIKVLNEIDKPDDYGIVTTSGISYPSPNIKPPKRFHIDLPDSNTIDVFNKIGDLFRPPDPTNL